MMSWRLVGSRPAFGLASLVLLLLLAVAPMSPSRSAEGLISFPLPPRTAAEETDTDNAVRSRNERARVVIEAQACGQEIKFLSWILDKFSDENPNGILIGKIQWLSQQVTSYDDESLRKAKCTFTHTLTLVQGPPDWEALGGTPIELSSDNGKAINGRAARDIDPSCAGLVQQSRLVPGLSPPPDSGLGRIDQLEITFAVDGLCMRAEVNKAVFGMKMQKKDDSGKIVDLQPGTDVLPCFKLLPPRIISSRAGDADVRIRDLSRLYFLNEQKKKLDGIGILNDDARSYLRDKLLSLHGGPGGESYRWYQCGNTEQSSGTPQELLDEAGWLDDAVDTLGDVASWFNAFILWFILLGASVAAVGLVLGSGVALVWWVYLES